MTKDWVQIAADEINDAGSSDDLDKWAPAIIRKHCPFKHDIAYMPVPRCDSCKHWTKSVGVTSTGPLNEGRCTLQLAHDAKMWTDLYDGIITEPDFGCVQWEAK